MPVEDHAVHPSTQKGVDWRYGCHNGDRNFTGYTAIQRFAGTTGHEPIWWLSRIRIPFTMSKECRYDMSDKDFACNGCKHRR